MNNNALEVLKYMLIHLIIFMLKILIKKSLKKDKKRINIDSKEINVLKQNLNLLKEEQSHISEHQEFAKFNKLKRQIDNLNDIIKKKEAEEVQKLILKESSKETNNLVFLKFEEFIKSKFLSIIMSLIEYIIYKNKYLEIENNKKNENNIIFNYFYKQDIEVDYALIPVHIILWFESIILNSLNNLIEKYMFEKNNNSSFFI